MLLENVGELLEVTFSDGEKSRAKKNRRRRALAKMFLYSLIGSKVTENSTGSFFSCQESFIRSPSAITLLTLLSWQQHRHKSRFKVDHMFIKMSSSCNTTGLIFCSDAVGEAPRCLLLNDSFIFIDISR